MAVSSDGIAAQGAKVALRSIRSLSGICILGVRVGVGGGVYIVGITPPPPPGRVAGGYEIQ
jgi:hypothetical protein